MRTRRVGSITLGLSMVAMGGISLAHMIFPSVSWLVIFRLWPVCFILLGLEVLASTLPVKDATWVYDKTAIVLTAVLTFFIMFMALVGTAAENSLTLMW